MPFLGRTSGLLGDLGQTPDYSHVGNSQGGLLPMDDPNGMGLLTAGAAMMQASGPSTTPVNFGQVMSQGLLGYMQGRQQMLDRQMQRQMQSAEADRKKRAESRSERELALKEQQSGQTGVMNEFNFARSQGYTGTFNDFMMLKGQATRPQTIVNNGAQSSMYGDPPKDYVWARNEDGTHVTEQDPTTGAQTPVAVPIGGSQQAQKAVDRQEKASARVDFLGNMVSDIDTLLAHQGLESAVGFSSVFPTLPGGQAANFEVLLESFGSKVFVDNIDKMRGTGSITEQEGKELKNSAAALSLSMSEDAFKSELRKIRGILNQAQLRTAQKAGRPEAGNPQDNEAVQPNGQPGGGGGSVIMDGMEYKKIDGQWMQRPIAK